MTQGTRFDGQRAYAHLHHLAIEIGARLGGSAEEKRAADYVESYFLELGLAARQQPFPRIPRRRA